MEMFEKSEIVKYLKEGEYEFTLKDMKDCINFFIGESYNNEIDIKGYELPALDSMCIKFLVEKEILSEYTGSRMAQLTHVKNPKELHLLRNKISAFEGEEPYFDEEEILKVEEKGEHPRNYCSW